MHGEPLWLEPDYFDRFHCKCGNCRNCCCNGWDVAVSRDEYFRLIGLECSDELHHKLECAFRIPEDPSPKRFRLISSNWLGECPMRDADGLCMLQKECGAEMLPEICRIYPRSLKKEGEMLQACCSNSCEAVVEALMAEDRLRFTFARLDARPELSERADVQSLILGRLCIEALQDRSLPLRMRIAQVCRLVAGAEIMPGDPALGLTILLDMLRDIRSANLERFSEGIFSRFTTLEEYAECGKKFEARFPDWERWMENILINHLVYTSFPLVDARIDPAESVRGLCGVWALLRALCIHYTADHPSEAGFADAAAGVFRMTEHSSFYYNSKVVHRDYWQLLSL